MNKIKFIIISLLLSASYMSQASQLAVLQTFQGEVAFQEVTSSLLVVRNPDQLNPELQSLIRIVNSEGKICEITESLVKPNGVSLGDLMLLLKEDNILLHCKIDDDGRTAKSFRLRRQEI